MICPQLTTLGSVKPRNDKPASNKIAEPTISADCTMIGGKAFGKIIPNINFEFDTPEALDAMTYSSSLILKNSARVILATAVQLTIPIAIVIMVRLAPKRATIPIENNRVGST